MELLSPLQQLRLSYDPKRPALLSNLLNVDLVVSSEPTSCVADEEEVRPLFPRMFGRPIIRFEAGGPVKGRPLRMGVLFSGGQAAGGHNVICGLFDAIREIHPESLLYGFLLGPGGLIDGKYEPLTAQRLALYRNQGGFDLIGSGRTKIETEEQLAASMKLCSDLKLDGLVIIGGDDSNTNAAILAEYLGERGVTTSVIGVPKTIDGDLKNEWVELSFGHDTACKVYAEMIGNLLRDAASAQKYTHFVKLMGRSASHIALECALQTHPNATLIGEELLREGKSLRSIAKELTDLICERAKRGKNYGLVLIPEGLIEFIPEVGELIREINTAFAKGVGEAEVQAILTPESGRCFASLPAAIRSQLLADRDPHGNVQVSHIATEQLLIASVQEELASRQDKVKFSPVAHFFGYEGRAALPSNFDANYCYGLGIVAALLALHRHSGYMAVLRGLAGPAHQWQPFAVPITSMMCIEERKGKRKPVIRKSLVDLDGEPFQTLARHRQEWAVADPYLSPGPIQFFGPTSLTETTLLTLQLEHN